MKLAETIREMISRLTARGPAARSTEAAPGPPPDCVEARALGGARPSDDDECWPETIVTSRGIKHRKGGSR